MIELRVPPRTPQQEEYGWQLVIDDLQRARTKYERFPLSVINAGLGLVGLSLCNSLDLRIEQAEAGLKNAHQRVIEAEAIALTTQVRKQIAILQSHSLVD